MNKPDNQKKKPGPKLIYETAEAMQEMIDKYVEDCEPKFLQDKDGEYILYKGQPIVIDMNKPTITGLCLFLGFESRQSFYDYEKREDFTFTVRRAKLHIENSYEKDIRNPDIKPTGSIFALKNLGWKDKTEVDNKHSGQVKIIDDIR